MKRVLVSGASGVVGYGILRSLIGCDQDMFLVGTSMHPNSVAPAFCNIFELAPPTSSKDYIPWLLSTLEKHNIDVLIPGIEIDMFSWTENSEVIKAAGATPILNEKGLVALCKDKWDFYNFLIEAAMPCAIPSKIDGDFQSLSKEFGLPFLLKPREGFGSKGIVRIHSEVDFQNHCKYLGSKLMAQPIVGNDDQEYTIALFCDGNGGYSASINLKRALTGEGFTGEAEVADMSIFKPTLDNLCVLLKPLGPTNFQFRLDGSQPLLLEINPRISSSTSIRAAFGYNESEMAVSYFFDGLMPVQPVIRAGRAIRYMSEEVFYEDSNNI